MQEPVPIGRKGRKSQRGSLLAGCLVLCLVLTSAAAGLLAVTGAWNSSVSGALERERLRDAAESGIAMGVRWLRALPGVLGSFADTEPISVEGLVMDGAAMDVYLERDAAAGTHDLVSIASLDGCRRYEIRWRIDVVGTTYDDDGHDPICRITFKDWRETEIPCGG